MTQAYVEGTEIKLGHALITMVEPTKDAHDLAEYNRWYEFDHAYEGLMVGHGAFSFRRFVATRDLKALHYPAGAATGSFIACYWLMKDSIEEHYKWAFPSGAKLAEAGRMNPNRTHISTSLYDFTGSSNRRNWPVGPQINLDHPYQGLVAVWIDRSENTPLRELDKWVRTKLVRTVLKGKVAAAMTFNPRDMPGAPNSGMGVGEKVLTLFFLQTHPSKVWASHFEGLGKVVEDFGLGRLSLAQGFIPVIPGTNTYLDQLW